MCSEECSIVFNSYLYIVKWYEVVQWSYGFFNSSYMVFSSVFNSGQIVLKSRFCTI